MFNGIESKQNNFYDSKTCFKSTPKAIQKNLNRRSIDKSDDINDGACKRFDEKLDTFIRESAQSKHALEVRIHEMEKQIQNSEVENQRMKTEIIHLTDNVEMLKNKMNILNSTELKIQELNSEFSNMSRDISSLRDSMRDFAQTKNSDISQYINGAEVSIKSEINNLIRTIDDSYSKKSDYLFEMINKIRNINLFDSTAPNFVSNIDIEKDVLSEYDDEYSESSDTSSPSISDAPAIVGVKNEVENLSIFKGSSHSKSQEITNAVMNKPDSKLISTVNDKSNDVNTTLFEGCASPEAKSINNSKTIDTKLKLNLFDNINKNESEIKSNLFGNPETNDSHSKSNLFGNINKNDSEVKPSIVGTTNKNESEVKPTIFGVSNKNQSDVKSSIFGNAKTNDSQGKSNIFGNANKNQSEVKSSIFGNISNNESEIKSNLFGNLKTNDSHSKSNLSGNMNKNDSEPKSSIFGTTNKNESEVKPNIFAANKNESEVKSSIFGNLKLGDSQVNSGLFGNTNKSESVARTNIFGNTNLSEPKTNIFGNGNKNVSELKSDVFGNVKSSPEVKTNIFGNVLTATSETKSNLFGNTLTSSIETFGSIATSTEKGFGSTSETKWQGGSKLFSNTQPKEEGDDVEEEQLEEHDPEFKPIIDLPPLIQIVRDEDNKDVLFKNRGKLYNFINNEWKERGVGDMKIFRSKVDGSVTMVMRRDQVHKLCCNQRITRDSHKFTPMSDKSSCWSCIDYSEAESSTVKFAIKFSDKSILDEFTLVIANAQLNL